MAHLTTLHRISELESTVSGFVTTDSSRWSQPKLIALLDEIRAVAITNVLMTGGRVHPDWLQSITIPFSSHEQNDVCYSTFPFPYSVIRAKKLNDGFYFVGNDSFTAAYDRVNTRGELLNSAKHPILARSFTQRVAALFEENQFTTYSQKGNIRTLGVSAIFSSPTSLPYFNLEKDAYPLDSNTFEFALGYARDKYMNQEEATKIQTPSVNKDTSQFSIPNRRR
jgi:hypothetical protein